MNDAELFERVLARAKERNLRNSDVARKLNISTVIFYKYKRTGARFSQSTRRAVINFLQEAVAPIITEQDIKAVPVFTVKQVAKLLSSGQINLEMASNQGTVLFGKASPGDFSLTVSGDAMMPWYPSGTKLLVGTQKKPKSGDRVVARVADSAELLFRVYVDLGGEFALLPINKDKKYSALVFDKMDKGVTWFSVFPIKQSLRDEDALDEAMKRVGKRHFWEDWLENREKRKAIKH